MNSTTSNSFNPKTSKNDIQETRTDSSIQTRTDSSIQTRTDSSIQMSNQQKDQKISTESFSDPYNSSADPYNSKSSFSDPYNSTPYPANGTESLAAPAMNNTETAAVTETIPISDTKTTIQDSKTPTIQDSKTPTSNNVKYHAMNGKVKIDSKPLKKSSKKESKTILKSKPQSPPLGQPLGGQQQPQATSITPIAIALLPSILSSITGLSWTEYVLFALVLYYLYKIVKVPGDLLIQTRSMDPRNNPNSSPSTISKWKEKESRVLALYTLAPAMGGLGLYYAQQLLPQSSLLQHLSVSLFFLASFLKPFGYLTGMLHDSFFLDVPLFDDDH